MKLQVLLFSILISSFNSNCKIGGRNNLPVEQHAGQSPDTVADNAGSSNDTGKAVRFGVMIAKTEGRALPPERQAQIAQALGVKYIRARIDMQDWNGSNNLYDAYSTAGLKVLLNINYGVPRNAMGEHAAIPFPTDMTAYSKTVNSILDKYKPEVVVVENEEDNPFYHSGSADDYINELKNSHTNRTFKRFKSYQRRYYSKTNVFNNL